MSTTATTTTNAPVTILVMTIGDDGLGIRMREGLSMLDVAKMLAAICVHAETASGFLPSGLLAAAREKINEVRAGGAITKEPNA